MSNRQIFTMKKVTVSGGEEIDVLLVTSLAGHSYNPLTGNRVTNCPLRIKVTAPQGNFIYSLYNNSSQLQINLNGLEEIFEPVGDTIMGETGAYRYKWSFLDEHEVCEYMFIMTKDEYLKNDA